MRLTTNGRNRSRNEIESSTGTGSLYGALELRNVSEEGQCLENQVEPINVSCRRRSKGLIRFNQLKVRVRADDYLENKLYNQNTPNNAETKDKK